MIYYVLPAASHHTMDEFFSHEGPAFVDRFRVIDFEQLPKMHRFERGTYVIAGIERATPAMKELITSLCNQLDSAGGNRILNWPGRTMGRFELLKRLYAAGKSEVRVARGNDNLDDLRYPVFIRSERGHDGNLSGLLDNPSAVRTALGSLLLEGHSRDELMLVEFCSTADAHGVYRKYAAYSVGGRILGRSLNAGRQWMLKLETSDFTRELVMEDQRYVMENPYTEQVAELFAFANIDFGQIDFSIKDGRVQPWEINLNPTIGRGVKPGGGFGPRELWPIRSETREFFFDRFRAAWIDLDSVPTTGRAVDVAFDPAVVEAAGQSRPRETLARRIARKLLRPVKPILKPLASKVLGHVASRLQV